MILKIIKYLKLKFFKQKYYNFNQVGYESKLIKKGDLVICKNNEPNKYFLGIFNGMQKLNKNSTQLLPYVICINNGIEYTGMLIFPYDEKIEEILKKLKPFEQYIFLTKGNPWGIPNGSSIKIINGIYKESKGYKMNGMRTYKKICSDLGIKFDFIDFGERSHIKGMTNDK